MIVHIKGNMRKSRAKHGEPYYIIVREDVENPNPYIKNKEIFAFVNAHRISEPLITRGELRQVCPQFKKDLGEYKLWKMYDTFGKIVDYSPDVREFKTLF